MGDEFDLGAALLECLWIRAGGHGAGGEIFIEAGEQLAGRFLSGSEQFGIRLFALGHQERAPIEADQILRAASDHFPRHGEHARAIAERLVGGQVEFLTHFLQFGLGILGLPLVQQRDAFLGRGLGAEGEHEIVFGAIGPLGGRGKGGGTEGRNRHATEGKGGLHHFFTVTIFFEEVVTSTSWRLRILPSCTVRISYFPTGTRTVAGTWGATWRPS